MIKVSVIIPVWNPGLIIERCIKSLRAQSLREIEMIFIDDCGSDRAMDFVQEAAKSDNRIRILSNTGNIGPGPSRNKGIEAAKGEYLAFLDPDDYFDPNFLEKLYHVAAYRDLDIVKGSVIYEKEDGSVCARDRNLDQTIKSGLTKHKPLYCLFTYEHFSALYRRGMVIENSVRYGFSRRAQDTTFLLQACSNAVNFEAVDISGYHFCKRSSSAMHRAEKKMIVGLIDAFEELSNYVLQNLSDSPYAQDYLVGLLLGYIRNIDYYIREGRIQASSDIERLREIVLCHPYYVQFRKRSFSVKALVDYHIILPNSIYKLPWENETADAWLELITRWIDFMIENRRCVFDSLKDFLKIYVRCYYSCKTDKEIQRLKGQMKRLPVYIRLLCHPIRVVGIYGWIVCLNTSTI